MAIKNYQSICACTSLKKTSRMITRYYEKKLAHAGLTATQFAILRATDRVDNIPLSRLAEQLVLDRTSLYRAIKPLLRESLIKLIADKNDRRAKAVLLTDQGKRRTLKASSYWEEAQNGFLAAFGNENWSKLEDKLVQVISKLENVI
jgi:DNA-binding MarR family transcriptional regulator